MSRRSRFRKALNRTFLDAIVLRNNDGIRAALKAGADVNARDAEHDETAIVLAAKFGDAEIIQTLIDAGAEVDARDDQGRTALFFAQVGSDIFSRLLAAGADVSEGSRGQQDLDPESIRVCITR